jgi:hypothetical protein
MRTHLKIATGLFVVALALAVVSPLDAAMLDEIKLLIPDLAAGDHFGTSVAISGNVAVVGAPDHDAPATGCGSAYAFNATTGTKTQDLIALDAANGDTFGTSVGVSGNVAVIGAPKDAPGGSAYLYQVPTGGYLRKLTSTDTVNGDAFGRSVDIDGGVAIVGAFGNDDDGSLSGSAYLFNVTTGSQLYKLTADDAAGGDNFGYSVAVSGDVAIVGAYCDDGPGSLNSGSAYLFNVTTGSQLHKLTADDAAASDYFGCSVGISGDVAIVGAYGDDDDGDYSGSAYLFNVTTGSQLHKLTAEDADAADYFGWSVGISGGVAVVGACNDDDAGGGSGSAYMFDVTSGAQLEEKLIASDADSGANFGFSVAVSGGRGIVGAYSDDDAGNNVGSAYLFTTPEPAALTLLALGGLGVLVRRKRKA